MLKLKDSKIAIIGLGYVGLPLAVELAKMFPVVGFDIHQKRVAELNAGHDRTLEVADEDLKAVLSTQREGVLESGRMGDRESGSHSSANSLPPSPQLPGSPSLFNTTETEELADCNVFIVTVPTPTDKHNRPVLTPLIKASETCGKVLKKGDVVIYESTVYPGVTEDECVPVLEKESGLKFNEDFFVGYSPERINPGDKEHTVTKIKKVTSGSTPEAGQFVDALYKSVIVAGTHLAPSIKVAEAAKVIENAQRDINIAFVNELAKIFNMLDIDTYAVLEAAGTKWNFLPFRPGLVGGHCIGVDPYYLAQKAQEVGYHPEIILAGRRMNDSMGKYVATEVVKCMMRKDLKVLESKVLMLGITFKENCPDIRNTRAIDIYRELQTYDMKVDVYDPWADPEEVKHEYGIDLLHNNAPDLNQYAAVVLAVSHEKFRPLELSTNENRVVYDVKGFLDRNTVDGRL